MITVELLEKSMQEKIPYSATLQMLFFCMCVVGQTLTYIKICTHTIYLIVTEKKKEKNSKETIKRQKNK